MPIGGIYGPDDFGSPRRGQPATSTRSRVSAAERARALPMPSLEWTPEVERATAHLYERVKKVISPAEWPFMAPYIKAINELKETRDAVIPEENYVAAVIRLRAWTAGWPWTGFPKSSGP